LVEKLELKVPWKSLYTSPTKAKIVGLYLLVVPKTGRLRFYFIFYSIFSSIIEVEYDAEREEKQQHETKMKEVHQIEELRKEKEAQSNETKTSFLIF
jgi:hypothetical protein